MQISTLSLIYLVLAFAAISGSLFLFMLRRFRFLYLFNFLLCAVAPLYFYYSPLLQKRFYPKDLFYFNFAYTSLIILAVTFTIQSRQEVEFKRALKNSLLSIMPAIALAVVSFLSESWISFEKLPVLVSLLGSLILVIFSVGAIVVCQYSRKKLAWFELTVFLLSFFQLHFYLSTKQYYQNFVFLSLGLFSIQEVIFTIKRVREDSLASFIVPRYLKNFLVRNFQNSNKNAAAIGIKTPKFIINHDPDNLVSSSFPATIASIRNSEILRSLEDVLGPGHVPLQVIDNQIFGFIDPEFSTRSCLDVLTIFSCLYLDSTPLIERKLRNLISLFPIINPELAKRVTTSVVDEAISYNYWLFHLDYNWTDQHVLKNKNQFLYQSKISDLDYDLRNFVFKYMRKRNQIGNFIWLGENARKKLLREAPMISSVIQASTIKADNKEEILIFLIKFEELIPRLQKYYDLDEKRKLLKDFEPRQEIENFLSLLSKRISETEDVDLLLASIELIRDQTLQGFKEKDEALRLVLEVFKKLDRHQERSAKDKFNAFPDQWRRKLVSAIENIGYPSKLIYDAQQQMLESRTIEKVLENAKDPRSKKFHESWLFLATGDLGKFSDKEIVRLLDFLERALGYKRIIGKSFVLIKAIECFSNIAQYKSPIVKTEKFLSVVEKYGYWIYNKQEFDREILSWYLDTLNYIHRFVNNSFYLNSELTELMQSKVEALSSKKASQFANKRPILERLATIIKGQKAA